MQRQLDLHGNAERRGLPGETSLWTIAFLLTAGGLSLYGATVFQNFAGLIGFAGIAIGLFTVSAFVLFQFARRTLPLKRARDVFSMVYQDRTDPCFASNTHGHVVLMNSALEAAQEDFHPENASQCLQVFCSDGPGIVYRLLSRLASVGDASELVVLENGAQIQVRAVQGKYGVVFWAVEAIDQPDRVDDDEPTSRCCPLVVTDDDGRIVDANSAVNAYFGDEYWDNADLQGVLDADQNTTNQIVTVGEQRFRLARGDLDNGRTETIFLPITTEELVVADPEQFYNTLPVAIARISDDGEVIYANDAAVELLGARARPGVRLADLMEGLGRSIDERIRDMSLGRSHMRSEVARAKVKGQEAFLQVTLKRLLLNGDTTILAVINDATELKTLEAQFVQSQKMHAVGQLAGGVAHDFNNLLTAINGHCDLVLMRHQPIDTDYGDLIQIRHNANRAASLVGQLLAFSRKQTLVPKVIDLYDTLSDLNHLLNRLLGEKVTLRIDAGQGLPAVRVDERQLEQVIMNLVVNARDAMPDGGEVEIKACEITLTEDLRRDNAVIPFGQYVQIDVSDTGVGIPADQIRKIFEPFFTTKKVGEGTGLGLSTAYGIIKQTGGFIFAQSEIGRGTTFTVYLPALSEEAQAAVSIATEDTPKQDLTGSGVVLLVEDEVPVRSFAARALTIRGYTVLEAESAEEALEILEDDDLHVDLFVSDVIMPGMDGPTWVKKAQEVRPDTKVVFVSGYAEDAFEGGQINVPNATFLPKPFSLNELTLKVKEQMSITIH